MTIGSRPACDPIGRDEMIDVVAGQRLSMKFRLQGPDRQD